MDYHYYNLANETEKEKKSNELNHQKSKSNACILLSGTIWR